MVSNVVAYQKTPGLRPLQPIITQPLGLMLLSMQVIIWDCAVSLPTVSARKHHIFPGTA